MSREGQSRSQLASARGIRIGPADCAVHKMAADLEACIVG